MARGYRHLTYEQRCQISILKTRGDYPSKIAKILDVPRSKIIRELHRNSEGKIYRPEPAQKKSENRRKRPSSKKMNLEMTLLIEEKLKMDLSPV